ncbi:hypothetical protein J26TS2_44850 [Shouchella clausii]|nr:hypothetical protein J26TS2_44850 [Shouchella clausii]
MKRVVIVFTSLFLLSACGGNSLGLDEDRLLEATQERALSYADIKNGDYEAENIELVKVCPAIRENQIEFGHQGDYLIFWQTDDGNNQNVDLMDENYEVGAGANKFIPVEGEECLEY